MHFKEFETDARIWYALRELGYAAALYSHIQEESSEVHAIQTFSLGPISSCPNSLSTGQLVDVGSW